MSFPPRITDDEMRYFQFKAKQLFLNRKEDHVWNEFCKRTVCTCCSCEKMSEAKVSNGVDVQTIPKQTVPLPGRRISALNSFPNKNLSQTLNEVKMKLERIDLSLKKLEKMDSALSNSKGSVLGKKVSQQLAAQEIKVHSCTAFTDPLNRINDKRIEIIQNSLKASLQRLHLSATSKAKNPPVSMKKKNNGYFLPQELQRQRNKARNAYLASLSKLKIETNMAGNIKGGAANSQKIVHSRLPSGKFVSKQRKTNNICVQSKEKTTATMINADHLLQNQDLNVENAVDNILDDMLKETVLIVHKIKLSKDKNSNVPKTTDIRQDADELNYEIQDRNFPKFNVVKALTNIRQGILHNAESIDKIEHENQNMSSVHHDKLDYEIKTDQVGFDISQIPCDNNQVESQNTRKLLMEPSTVSEIVKQRNKYMEYLERISRTKKGNFNPWMLSTMVSESLLNDCIEEISREIQDLPTSLIADLYDKEFLQTL